ncbi:hypothetical protein SKAU_G00110850 [Synaphobranchus kaupii]|uniref:Uncharacterized protein n=1 Tax=Synaphobranchus kaupii TaxID=118154 RepID=A0A9Q1J7B4_SYNKA|nr:hypothetical protein SKAU_G00110850 [Synaphobranchus kaupii]
MPFQTGADFDFKQTETGPPHGDEQRCNKENKPDFPLVPLITRDMQTAGSPVEVARPERVMALWLPLIWQQKRQADGARGCLAIAQGRAQTFSLEFGTGTKGFGEKVFGSSERAGQLPPHVPASVVFLAGTWGRRVAAGELCLG